MEIFLSLQNFSEFLWKKDFEFLFAFLLGDKTELGQSEKNRRILNEELFEFAKQGEIILLTSIRANSVSTFEIHQVLQNQKRLHLELISHLFCRWKKKSLPF